MQGTDAISIISHITGPFPLLFINQSINGRQSNLEEQSCEKHHSSKKAPSEITLLPLLFGTR